MLCRGPLPAGHPQPNVVYFCADADLALAACGLATAPPIQNYHYTEKTAVLLDAHRAPDEWFGAACRMPHLTIQGDPDAIRPVGHNLFATELAKESAEEHTTHPNLQCTPTLSAALPHARGRCVVLCGTYDMRNNVFDHLRPNGLSQGDGAVDRYGRYTEVHSVTSSTHYAIDGGRRMVRRDMLEQHVTASPSTVRAGEYDTVIVMPDVPEKIAKAVCKRTRYLIVGVAHSPMAYVVQKNNMEQPRAGIEPTISTLEG